MATASSGRDFRERYHSCRAWAALWPVRTWFNAGPIQKGKGALDRLILRPAMPPEPAGIPL